MFDDHDTIAAISTPLGGGGIGIVRISGPEAFAIAKKLFMPVKGKGSVYPRDRYLYYGRIIDEQDEIIDEVLVSFMKAPYTYTREDIVEINCHSGVLTLKMILDLVLRAGARLAAPGEFTRRAFLNGRLDLSQAESILKIINARSEKAVKLAAMNLEGRLSRHTNTLREEMLNALARLEASLDFPEDQETELETVEELKKNLTGIKKRMQLMVQGAARGRVYQDGIPTAIVGKPNVGKSSLLNALLRQQRAIVHEVPGTTRDLLEGRLTIEGYPICLIDTAGIHRTEDPVEKEGIHRTRAAAEQARLVLIVLDGSSPWSSEDDAIVDLVHSGQEQIFVINKSDLPQKIDSGSLSRRFPEAVMIGTAATRDEGIDQLEDVIVELLDQSLGSGDENPMLLSLRHEETIREALQHIENAADAVDNQPLEIVSMELREAWTKMGEITGETVSDELLDRIFSQFCLGK